MTRKELESYMGYIKMVVIVIAFLFFAGFGIGSSIQMPDNAFIYVDDSTKTYISPPFVTSKDKLRLVRYREIRGEKYNPDPSCREENGFMQEGRSLSGNLLESIGVLSSLISRWNVDGTWNW